jgi:hypothetical protein
VQKSAAAGGLPLLESLEASPRLPLHLDAGNRYNRGQAWANCSARKHIGPLFYFRDGHKPTSDSARLDYGLLHP